MRADNARTVDATEFSQLLDQLNEDSESLTNNQKHYLWYLQGYQLIFSGQIDEGTRRYKDVLEQAEDQTMQFRANYSLANVYANINDFEQSISYLNQALEQLPGVTDTEVANFGLVAASVIYNQIGQYELGLAYADKLLQNDVQGRHLCLARLQKIEAVVKLGLSVTETEFSESISHCENNDQHVLANIIRMYYAKFQLAGQDEQTLLDYLLLHIEDVESTQYSRLIAEFYALLSRAHWSLDHEQMARAFAERTLEHTEQEPYSEPVVTVLDILYKIEESNGNYLAALDYHKRHSEADKAYLDEVSAKNLAFQMAQHDLKEKNSRIELLNKENQVLQLQQNLDREAAENTRLLLILLSAVIGFIALWALRTKRNQIRFKEMAQCDELTGAFNRRHFSELSNHHLQIAESNYSSVALVMFDLDHFKSINDRFGHPVGDWVLQETINVCKQFCRENDVFGRLGGEEFAVLLPGCNLRHAEQFAEKCRRSIASINSSATGHEFSVQASFGVSEATEDGFKLKDVISAADEALYVAKSRGRNQVVCSDQLSESTAPTPDQVA